jgi:hypothetical protein
MRIRFTQSIAGETWCYLPGEVHDLPVEIARQYIEHDIAVPADDLGAEAAAVVSTGRHAVKRRPRETDADGAAA